MKRMGIIPGQNDIENWFRVKRSQISASGKKNPVESLDQKLNPQINRVAQNGPTNYL